MTIVAYKKFGFSVYKFISHQAFSYYYRAAQTLDDTLVEAHVENIYISYDLARITKQDRYLYLGLASRCLEAKENNASKKIVS
ncbi:hypothetical protein IFN73_11990 [Francisella tularensis subsp. holarctica]|nr:hypothetical protein [Francisella tularensis subsp. holarctica]